MKRPEILLLKAALPFLLVTLLLILIASESGWFTPSEMEWLTFICTAGSITVAAAANRSDIRQFTTRINEDSKFDQLVKAEPRWLKLGRWVFLLVVVLHFVLRYTSVDSQYRSINEWLFAGFVLFFLLRRYSRTFRRLLGLKTLRDQPIASCSIVEV